MLGRRQPGTAPARDNREFARIDVKLVARLQPLDDERADRLRGRIGSNASVWTPADEATLRELANRSTGAESVLAQAVLELCSQVVHLRARLLDAEPVKRVLVRQISGGGGQLESELPLDRGDLVEIRFEEDEDEEVPPIVALVRIVHRLQDRIFGFAFEAIHPRDQDLLMRFIYRIQRRALRRTRSEGGA